MEARSPNPPGLPRSPNPPGRPRSPSMPALLQSPSNPGLPQSPSVPDWRRQSPSVPGLPQSPSLPPAPLLPPRFPPRFPPPPWPQPGAEEMQRSVTGGGGEGGGGKMLFVLVPTLAGIITALSLLACCLWRRKRLHERARSAGDDISMTTIQRMRGAHKEAKSGSSNSSTAGTESGSEAADSSARAQALRMVRAPEIPESEITLGRMLGRGGSGTVRAGTWLGMAVAVKKLDERTSGDQQQRSNLERMPHRARTPD